MEEHVLDHFPVCVEVGSMRLLDATRCNQSTALMRHPENPEVPVRRRAWFISRIVCSAGSSRGLQLRNFVRAGFGR